MSHKEAEKSTGSRLGLRRCKTSWARLEIRSKVAKLRLALNDRLDARDGSHAVVESRQLSLCNLGEGAIGVAVEASKEVDLAKSQPTSSEAIAAGQKEFLVLLQELLTC